MWVRPATGLVKSFSTFDMWLFNTFSGVPILQPWYMFPLIVFNAAGNFFIGGTMALGLACIPAAVYAFMAASMPRSGGDYVYWSRLIHPAPGFMVSLSLVFWINWWVGSNMWGTAAFFGDLMTDCGFSAFANWVYTTPGTFVTGIILTLILVAILATSVKSFRYLQALCFGWALLACVEMIIFVVVRS